MKRIQRKRSAGWRMPPGAKYCGRPTKYGNPYKIGEIYKSPFSATGDFVITRENCIELFRTYAKGMLAVDPHWLDPLRDVDLLACFCPLTEPCHVDVIIELLEGNP